MTDRTAEPDAAARGRVRARATPVRQLVRHGRAIRCAGLGHTSEIRPEPDNVEIIGA